MNAVSSTIKGEESNIFIGEKNKATSLSCGLNGGSTGT